jgi:hypothetical protein
VGTDNRGRARRSTSGPASSAPEQRYAADSVNVLFLVILHSSSGVPEEALVERNAIITNELRLLGGQLMGNEESVSPARAPELHSPEGGPPDPLRPPRLR